MQELRCEFLSSNYMRIRYSWTSNQHLFARISNLSAAMHVRQFSRELQCALQFGLIPDETHATVVFIPIQHEACCRITLSGAKKLLKEIF